MARKPKQIDALLDGMQRADTQSDKLTVPGLHELPRPAAVGHLMKETNMYDIHSAQGDLFAFVNGGLKPQEPTNTPAGAGVTAHDGKVPPPISSTRAQDAPCGRRLVADLTSNPSVPLDGAAIRAAIQDQTWRPALGVG